MNEYFDYEDKLLIELLRNKDSKSNEAFNIIYSRYSERLKSYCLFKSSTKEDSKELFQETWLKFHAAVLAGNNSISMPAFIYTIAHNLSIDKYRIKKNQFVFYNEDFNYNYISDAVSLQLNIENRELLEMINLALNQMNEIYRETFVLKWFSGLTYPEIAEVLGESLSCVKQRCARAMDMLLKILHPVIKEINNQGML